MEIESNELNDRAHGSRPLARTLRSKTHLRMRYEAEVSLLQKQLGGLEKVRGELGLSARKICQLLLVDPSAWNRWCRPGGKAPPHVWRALQWYLLLHDKWPGIGHGAFLSQISGHAPRPSNQDQILAAEQLSLHNRIANLEGRAEVLAQELKQSQRMIRVYEMAGTLLALVCIGFVLFLFFRSRH